MKYFLVALQLSIVSTANAHCYSIWNYPTPQRCGIAARGTDPNDHSWYVEITKLPPDIEREVGIEKLKEQMK